MAMPFGQNNHY